MPNAALKRGDVFELDGKQWLITKVEQRGSVISWRVGRFRPWEWQNVTTTFDKLPSAARVSEIARRQAAAWRVEVEYAQRHADYLLYLNSPEWASVRRAAIDGAGGTCERCGRRGAVEVHHLVYERLGNEDLDDLEVLCGPCHRKEHGTSNSAKRLT